MAAKPSGIEFWRDGLPAIESYFHKKTPSQMLDGILHTP